METIALTKSEFLKRIVDYEKNPTEWKYLGDKPAIVDFYANWCGPCKMVSPIMEELAEEYAGRIYVYKINTQEEPELAAAFGIRSIPSVLFIPLHGNPQKSVGVMSKKGFKKAVQDLLLT
ncbi:MAG: thioredoxin [Prevotella sp.]|jgi:thioredoxin|nr:MULTISPECIES: thioredoxin [unclassified Prevotella]MCH3970056.1 thioredoxin [Prevotella sp.]MCH3985944.1 thioredoxin [Prevotella sp.]MCH4018540.1 thioredoxin [Prevotella sp.]MCH4100350.1 thioredoxin [Prevotella sp.]MCH4185435.1 thioredoxin [Prevotella sp.]